MKVVAVFIGMVLVLFSGSAHASLTPVNAAVDWHASRFFKFE